MMQQSSLLHNFKFPRVSCGCLVHGVLYLYRTRTDTRDRGMADMAGMAAAPGISFFSDKRLQVQRGPESR